MCGGQGRGGCVPYARHSWRAIPRQRSAEQLGVASYTALIAGAQALGDQETAAVCQRILGEDTATTEWLARHLPGVVQETLREVTTNVG
jgi:ferritin-like metal-binding protein YciE